MLGAVGFLAEVFGTALGPSALLLSAVAFLFVADILKSWRPKNYPPGPLRLPFVGNFLHLDFEQWHLSLQRVRAGEVARSLACKTKAIKGIKGGRLGGSDAKAGT